MIKSVFNQLFGRGKPISPEQAKKLARHDDAKVRAHLATLPHIQPELLYFLAEDKSTEVRQQVASNKATPALANLLLSKDEDEQVRGQLAAKIAALSPGLTPTDQDKMRRITYEALDFLARDQIPKVRQILAETLKDIANAPTEVIGRLARDADIAVASPILCYSPVLTDEDLLDIISSSPIPGALSAISRRNSIPFVITDAIASTEDGAAIAILLANQSAQIREETLDRLVDRAVDIEEWHLPLVSRPVLSPKSTQKLARFVAAHLLQALADRQDLDPQSAQAVAEIVRKRLDEMDIKGPEKSEARKAAEEGIALERAKVMMSQGQLDESAVDTALTGGDNPFVIAALSVLSDLPLTTINKTIANQSAKGIVSVVWKAGLSMALAVQLQTKLLHLPPNRILHSCVSGFPLSPSEMSWHLEFLTGE
jgi:uncharacterized protein (DUF2336 family)